MTYWTDDWREGLFPDETSILPDPRVPLGVSLLIVVLVAVLAAIGPQRHLAA